VISITTNRTFVHESNFAKRLFRKRLPGIKNFVRQMTGSSSTASLSSLARMSRPQGCAGATLRRHWSGPHGESTRRCIAAASVGRLVIAPNFGGISDYLAGTGNALYDAGSPKVLARAMEHAGPRAHRRGECTHRSRVGVGEHSARLPRCASTPRS